MNSDRYIKDGRVDENSIYRDAWRIADPGAVNPVAVAGTLRDASSALLHTIGTADVRRHPALRVIVGQLAMLYGVDSIGPSIEDLDTVKARVDALTKAEDLTENS